MMTTISTYAYQMVANLNSKHIHIHIGIHAKKSDGTNNFRFSTRIFDFGLKMLT